MGYTVGFIGTGNMGGALARAAAKAQPDRLLLADHFREKAAALASQLGGEASDNETIAASCDLIFLGVKPQMMAGMLGGIAPVLSARKTPFTLVSMAAALSIQDIRRMAGDNYSVIRIMPNTPVAVGSGIVLYDAAENVTAQVLENFKACLAYAGKVDALPEALMDAASAISGCGPAYACMFIEAMADGGVACGLPRAKAQEYAARMLMGTAKLILESGQHPGELKDAVCSPGGSTIAGVRALEQSAFRAAAMDAVEAAYLRTKEMAK